MPEKKPFRRFKRKDSSLTLEQKVEEFIIRNSKSGFFTKISTIPYKFEISESRAWDIVGELLGNGLLETTHDEFSGEMKLCETGKMYSIMDLERERKRQKNTSFKRKSKHKTKN